MEIDKALSTATECWTEKLLKLQIYQKHEFANGSATHEEVYKHHEQLIDV